MTEYHNPYHFAPVKPDARPDDLSRDRFPAASAQVTHDRYYPGAYSGRIICRLTTESPIFIGAKRTDPTREAPAEVKPFELEGKPAIPASTLRGLISSIAEAASNSALRVLEDKPYSFRQKMEESLSAIGMIILDRDADGHLKLDKNGNPQCLLRPLTLPTIETEPDRTAKLPDGYNGMFPQPNLKVYIGDKSSIRDDNFPYETFSFAHEKYYGLKLRKRSWDGRERNKLPYDTDQHTKNRFLLAQNPIIKERPRAWDELSDDEKKDYTRGILRVFGCAGKDDIPESKEHELFIPYPEEAEKDWLTFPIPPEVIERFYDLADQRTEASDEDAEWPWPYHPKGTARNLNPENGKDRRFRLKDGDLVYFRSAGLRKISEISLSSIWRGRVESSPDQRATAHTFFEKISPELLPFNPARKVITVAEQVFGFVEQSKANDQNTALNLAGRVYFSHARVQGIRMAGSTEWESDARGLSAPYLPAVTLKILDSPKPPSPALYFKVARGKLKHIAKKELKPEQHHPQGRKFYLHHRPRDVDKEPWRSRFQHGEQQMDLDECRFKQKAKVSPLRRGAVFYFHIDFDNLSKRELGLLLYALKPTPDFQHKLGMGKPLGLGRVDIEPVGIFRVDRQQRYTFNGLFAPRYSEVWISPSENPVEWPDEYAIEKAACGNIGTESTLQNDFFEDLNHQMDKDIRRALELLGDPGALRARVHTPLVDGAEDEGEKDTYRWFVANDLGSGNERQGNRVNAARKCLDPLNEQSQKPAVLPALQWND